MLSFLYTKKFPTEERKGDKVSGWVYDVTCKLLQIRQTCLKLIRDSVYISYKKSIHKMHVTIVHVGKHKRHFCNSVQPFVTQ
jgi:hypothetical protein